MIVDASDGASVRKSENLNSLFYYIRLECLQFILLIHSKVVIIHPHPSSSNTLLFSVFRLKQSFTSKVLHFVLTYNQPDPGHPSPMNQEYRPVAHDHRLLKNEALWHQYPFCWRTFALLLTSLLTFWSWRMFPLQSSYSKASRRAQQPDGRGGKKNRQERSKRKMRHRVSTCLFRHAHSHLISYPNGDCFTSRLLIFNRFFIFGVRHA